MKKKFLVPFSWYLICVQKTTYEVVVIGYHLFYYVLYLVLYMNDYLKLSSFLFNSLIY